MMSLVMGGSGSGKSAAAETMLEAKDASVKYYIATMQVFGEEGQQKVEKHRKARAGKGFRTIEQPRDIGAGIRKMGNEIPKERAVLLECMSNLTANEMFAEESACPAELAEEKIMEGIRRLRGAVQDLIVVSNNVFEDGICYDTSTMEYLRLLAGVNRQLADMADEVIEIVAGIPVILKQEGIRQ